MASINRAITASRVGYPRPLIARAIRSTDPAAPNQAVPQKAIVSMRQRLALVCKNRLLLLNERVSLKGHQIMPPSWYLLAVSW